MADKELKTGGVYSFTTVNASLLGGTYEKARVTGNLEYSTAKLIEPNLDAIQASILPYLVDGASTKHTSYKYFVFLTQAGTNRVFAQEWINKESIVENTINYLDIRISSATSSDLASIRSILGLSGWSIVNEIK